MRNNKFELICGNDNHRAPLQTNLRRWVTRLLCSILSWLVTGAWLGSSAAGFDPAWSAISSWYWGAVLGASGSAFAFPFGPARRRLMLCVSFSVLSLDSAILSPLCLSCWFPAVSGSSCAARASSLCACSVLSCWSSVFVALPANPRYLTVPLPFHSSCSLSFAPAILVRANGFYNVCVNLSASFACAVLCVWFRCLRPPHSI